VALHDGALSLGRWHRLVPRGGAGVSWATSIKSVDLNSPIYRDAERLSARLNAYVDQLARFGGANRARWNMAASDIKARILNVAIPRNSGTAVQRAAIAAVRQRAKDLGIDLMITPF